jgi:BCD family chlorophyll transporter-like MFS transporter
MIMRRAHIAALGAKWLPFADAGSTGLPLAQLLRLGLFQVSVGMASVLLLGTLNRVMIVELSVPATVVALMIALPVLSAPFRALLGFKSDSYRSALGWKRIPYLWFGSLWQMGGLAVMPFAVVVLGGHQALGPTWAGEVLAALAFIMAGIGLHMVQTAGLALAADRADEAQRPRVVALLYVMFLIGTAISALVIGALLTEFSDLRLIRVVQGAALLTLGLNLVALWKQEKLRPMTAAELAAPRPNFGDAWRDLMAGGTAGRLLAVVALGALGFNMQDVLLEPYGGEVLGLSVAATTALTAVYAGGSLIGFGLAARWLGKAHDAFRLAGRGVIIGIGAFAAVVLAGPMESALLFFAGAAMIGLGSGLFFVSTLTAAMALPSESKDGRLGGGLVLGAWGAAQATAAGLSIAFGGSLRDAVAHLAAGSALDTPAFGYTFVYHTEIGLLFVTLIVLGPLVRTRLLTEQSTPTQKIGTQKIGLADFPT